MLPRVMGMGFDLLALHVVIVESKHLRGMVVDQHHGVGKRH
jgi:hypothetical protein